MRFVDTNILVYATCATPEDAEKSRIAQELLTNRDLALSVQVIQEFYTQVTRPTRPGALTHDEATRFIESLQRFPVQALTLATVWAALDFRERFNLSYWDCAILAAARQSGCDSVLSEDMSSNQNYDGLHITNPFAGAAPAR